MSDTRQNLKPVQMSLFARPTKNATWVATHLNTSTQTVCRLIEDGTLQAYKIRERGPWHIFLDSVADFEAQIKHRHGLQMAQDSPRKGPK